MISEDSGDSDCDEEQQEEEEKGIWKELSHDYEDENCREPSLL